jgi:DNA polymerase II small subunit/DNA polymerase delta subunit B
MSSPIGFREFNEDEYRKFIRTLSDEELLEAGKRLRILCGDVVTTTLSAFDRQLEICREE